MLWKVPPITEALLDVVDVSIACGFNRFLNFSTTRSLSLSSHLSSQLQVNSTSRLQVNSQYLSSHPSNYALVLE